MIQYRYQKAQLENFDKATERKIKNMELERVKKARADYINPELGLAAKERGNDNFREGKFPEAIKEYVLILIELWAISLCHGYHISH